MPTYAYARVSTDGQTLDAQRQALIAAGAAKVFEETASGAKSDRKKLTEALRALNTGDTLLVTRLDRLARSTRDLLNTLDAISKAGATFRSLSDQWADTTTPHGRLMLTVLGGLAEFERELIRARTGEGRERAKARGQHMGRPPRLTPHQKAEALKALQDGSATQADLARRFAVSQSTISRLSENLDAPLPAPKLDAQTRRATQAFLTRIADRYPMREALLFGSRARGTHRSESDADVAVILKGEAKSRFEVAGEMAGIAFDVMQETGVLVDPLPIWEDELADPKRFSNPSLLETIQREGLRL